MFKNQSLQIQLTIQCAQLNAGDSKGCVGNDQHIVVVFFNNMHAMSICFPWHP